MLLDTGSLAPCQARKLEGELDVKMAAYAKLCAGFEATYRLRAGTDSAALGADQVRGLPAMFSL
jgi:hypothetical protein